MRVLITGATGQVGSALLQSLAPYAELVAADRAALDLTRPGELASRLDALRPDVIVNPAAYTAVDRAEDERDIAFVVNGESPGAIARWAAARKVPLIHFSTDYAFDGSGTRPWQEDDPTGPLNVYGASKLAGEKAVHEAGGARLIVRTSWVYAASGSNFLRTIVRLAQEHDELRIVADQIGAPTSATWIAEAVGQIFAGQQFDFATAFQRANHSVNIAAAGETSWYGFASGILQGLRQRNRPVKTKSIVPIVSKDYPVKALRPQNSRLDISRMTGLFQITPVRWELLLERELDRLGL
jgi:dTDP-4-dehydrorhamnose reductase